MSGQEPADELTLQSQRRESFRYVEREINPDNGLVLEFKRIKPFSKEDVLRC